MDPQLGGEIKPGALPWPDLYFDLFCLCAKFCYCAALSAVRPEPQVKGTNGRAGFDTVGIG